MSSRRHYTRALYIYSKWVDTVPLSKVRGHFPSLVTPWEGNPILSPIRKGAVPVSNQKTAGHSLQSVDQWSQSPICRPVQITVDWPIKRLSSRDGTYLSVMQWSQFLSHLKLIQYFKHKLWYFPSTTVQFLNPNVWYLQYNSFYNTPIQVPHIYNFTTTLSLSIE